MVRLALALLFSLAAISCGTTPTPPARGAPVQAGSSLDPLAAKLHRVLLQQPSKPGRIHPWEPGARARDLRRLITAATSPRERQVLEKIRTRLVALQAAEDSLGASLMRRAGKFTPPPLSEDEAPPADVEEDGGATSTVTPAVKGPTEEQATKGYVQVLNEVMAGCADLNAQALMAEIILTTLHSRPMSSMADEERRKALAFSAKHPDNARWLHRARRLNGEISKATGVKSKYESTRELGRLAYKHGDAATRARSAMQDGLKRCGADPAAVRWLEKVRELYKECVICPSPPGGW